MQWLHDRGTLFKLVGSFGVVCVIMAAVGWMGFSTAGGVKTNLDQVGTNNVPTVLALAKTQASMLRVQRDIAQAVLTSGQQETDTFVASARDRLSTLDTSWAAYKALPMSDAEKQIAPRFESTYKDWRADAEVALAQAKLNTDVSNAAAADILLHKAASQATAMNAALDELVAQNDAQVATQLTESDAAFVQAQMLLVGIIGAGVLLALGIGVFVARSLASPLEAMTLAAKGLSVGDIDQKIDLNRGDEVGQTAAAFREMIAYQREISAVAAAMADGDLTQSVQPKGERDVLGLAFQQMAASLREVIGQVKESAAGLAGTSDQLSHAAAQTSGVVQQVTQAVQNVAAGSQDTSHSAQASNAAVGQLGQAIDGIARGASDQARRVQAVSATATQMAAGVEQVASNAQSVAAASQQTKVSAESGARAVRETVDGMTEIKQVVATAAGKVQELGKLGEKIGAVVETIDDIAEQTNLLALNAAIEAARAGEHGRGFAVVADEVRKLAERSQRETRAIADLIREIQAGTKDAVGAMTQGSEKVEQGAARADEAGKALGEILAAVEATVSQVNGIATAAQEMAGGARGVVEDMGSISAVVEQSSAATEQMAAQAGQVRASIESIAAVAEESSAATEQVSASAEEMSAQVEEMSAQAEELAATAEQLKSLVARFQIENTTSAVVARRRAADWSPSRAPSAGLHAV